MIQGMVSGLAEKLAEEPDNLPGWQRLIRSYTVLGKKAEALKAIADANAQFAGNADALARLEATRQSLGL